jgi:tetratricopeptide (TPR) repeat protein
MQRCCLVLDRGKILDSAQKFLKKGQVRKAISDYEKLVADDPRNIRIRTKLADLYVRNNDTARAVEAYIQLARQYEDEDLNSRAISLYKKVLTLRPNMVDAHYWLADLYKKEGLLGNAKLLYQNIIKLNPADQIARRNITDINQGSIGRSSAPGSQPVSSLEGLDAGVTLSHDRLEDLEEPLLLDDVLDIDEPPAEQAQPDDIVELDDPLDLPAEMDGNNPPPTGKNPQFTHQQVDLDEVVSPEKDLESHYHLGIAYMEMDLVDKAISEFEAALGYDPKKIDCLVMLSQCYMEKGLFERSIGHLQQALQLNRLAKEEYTRIYRELGKVYQACGMKDKAVQAFQRAGLSTDNSAQSKR